MSPERSREQTDTDTAATEIWGRLAAADRPLFWMIAAGVFLANSLLSTVNGAWMLGSLQAVTGLLALISAATVANRNHRQSPRSDVAVGDSRHATEPSTKKPEETD